MKFIHDHDLHIHSRISPCGGDPAQTPERILQYALDNQLKTICITDHYWDDTVPSPHGKGAGQTTSQIMSALPLPQADGVRFMFGAECEMDLDFTIGLGKEMADKLDFIIVPLNHLHMNGFSLRGDEGPAERAELIIKRFDALLDSSLPFHKTGVAHFTDGLIYTAGKNTDVLNLIPESEYRRLFRRAAEAGLGIELNIVNALDFTREKDADELKVYRIAKEMGCKFYFGSDAHTVEGLMRRVRERCEKIVDLLDLTEDDKFTI